jgi:hypothetical protein
LFAGGRNGNASFDTVDIYSDLTPTPILSGYFTGQPGGTIAVTVINSGDADFPAAAAVALYASPDRTLPGAILLGRATLPTLLAAGASVQVDVPTTIPADAPPGDYHLLAAAGPSNNLTPIAAQSQTFTI